MHTGIRHGREPICDFRSVPNDDEWKRFLKEGLTVGVIMYNGACIGVEMPKSLELKITETEPGVKVTVRTQRAIRVALRMFFGLLRQSFGIARQTCREFRGLMCI